MRAARAIMADLAATGMTPDQIALVMELSAAVSAEARPISDEAADRRRDRDREYQAEKRAARRQISADSDDAADDAPLSLPPNDIYSNPPTHTPVITTRTRKGLDRPDGVEPQVWTDFVNHRKRLKAPPSQTAVDGIRREAVKAGVTLNEALSECVSQGWRGFRADWLASKPTRNATASNDSGDLVKSILARANGP